MKKYTVEKVLNNNVVLSQENGRKIILVGKGIGFNAKKGGIVDRNVIENIFINKDSLKSGFDNLFNNIDKGIIGVSEEIISMCESELNIKFGEAIHVSLPDHISFAFHRIKEGIKIENPFLSELVVLYPKEYELAEKSMKLLNTRFKIKLPEDETGFICMHINAALNQKEVGNVMEYTRKIGEIMNLISKLLKKKFDKNSLPYIRTVTHINFMLNRIIKRKTIKNSLLDSIKKELYTEYNLAIIVAMKIENLFSVKVPDDEIGYIALHLSRLREI